MNLLRWLSTFTIFSILTTPTFSAKQPRKILWSTNKYGPDGPWQAVKIEIGSPSQPVDLYPGGTWQSNILPVTICLNETTSSTCFAEQAGLYNSSASSTVSSFAVAGNGPNSTVDWTFGAMPLTGSARWIFDNINIREDASGSPRIPISLLSMYSIDEAYETLPDGSTFPIEVGTLALGAPAYNQSFNQLNGLFNGSLLPWYLYETNQIESASYGLHIGSSAMGIPGSLLIGGYDQSRVLGTVTTQIYGSNFLPIDLLDVGIGVAEGGSPFNFTQQTGLLAKGNSSLGHAIPVNVDSTAPYLYLPRSTCDAIASYLPVTYQAKYDLYFWTTTDPLYTQIVSSPAILTFTFRLDRSISQNVTINVPFRLLNLTLQAPLTTDPIPYFPCRPLDHGSYTLGRAFLQAAFVGVSWQSNPNGVWFLAQAPGPNTPFTAVTTIIPPSALTINASQNLWLDSWRGSWTVLNATTTTPPSNSVPVDSGLSVAAKAGIGAACGAAAIAIAVSVYWYLTKKKHRREDADSEPRQPSRRASFTDQISSRDRYSAAGFGPNELPSEIGQPRPELDGRELKRPPYELGTEKRWEMSG